MHIKSLNTLSPFRKLARQSENPKKFQSSFTQICAATNLNNSTIHTNVEELGMSVGVVYP